MRLIQVAMLGVAVLTASVCARAAGNTPDCPKADAVLQGNVHDFDFLLGDWTVHNRRLKQRLANSREWIEFEAKDAFQSRPGNLGTEEHYSTKFWKDFVALGLHLYDPQHQSWVLYWADNRNAPGTMQTLAKGGFVDGMGVFCARDTFNGKPITVRILWKQLDASHARWEQAFSPDHGKSWETNWTMDFTRR